MYPVLFLLEKQNVSITKVYKLCYCCCSEHQVQFVPICFHLSKAFVGAPGVGINLSAAITLQTKLRGEESLGTRYRIRKN